MANLFYDFIPGALITPYVGAGAGIAFADSSINGCSMCSTQFAYQGIIGLGWNVDQNIRPEYDRVLQDIADYVHSQARDEVVSHVERVKREIVTMGEPDIDPTLSAGHYVDPHDWNALIADPDTVVIDTRNDYEVAIGTFAGAVDPRTGRKVGDFADWTTHPNNPGAVAAE